ncbi:MAG: LLM class F420-dependent oxidoreductase [Deltaproteobacteria bacterium]|nr:LLM class F420-dependent oxidoreductase [Deltaproteobacteria bacterium]
MGRHPIRFGVQTAPQQISWAELRETWQEVETLGFDTLWTNDHLLPSVGPPDAPNLEGWTMLGAIAALTTRVQIGVMVTSNTFRHPAVVAKMATTVDHISGGRLILGIGSGYFAQEHQVYGIPLNTPRRRARQLEEALQVIRKLWTEEDVSFTGKYYQLANAPFAPKPLQKPHPPIMIGGTGEKLTLPLVAKYADLWNAGGLGIEALARKVAILEEHCGRIGRNGSDIEKTYLTPLYLRSNPAEVEQLLTQIPQVQALSIEQMRALILAGDVAAVQRQVQAYLDIGITHLIIALRRPGFYDREGLRLFAREVMPAFR